MSDMKVNDLIALQQDIPEHKLIQGQIGRVIEILRHDDFEADFRDDVGHLIAQVRLKLNQVRILLHEATLNDEKFWELIEDTKVKSNGDSNLQVELLIDRIAQMSLANIFEYERIFDKFHDLAYRSDLWAAAFIINGGCGDDGFMDFRAWLIAQGKQIYDEALRDPETLVDVVEGEDDEFGRLGYAFLEKMNYIPRYAYEKKTGESMPLFPGSHLRPDLVGEIWDEDTFYEMYPKLAAKFH
jgi:hypothetical protein